MNIGYGLSRIECTLRGLMPGADPGEIAEIADLKNLKPNSGGFTPASSEVKGAEEVVAKATDGKRRAVGMDGFEGMALDDALAYVNERKHFSFFAQAKAIARIARRVEPTKPSILELGCGGGDMSHFFGIVGLPHYAGVEGNALAFKFSPYIRRRPRHFHCLNLQQEIDFGRAFAVVCSFEVLEHIPETSLDGIIKTIKNHMAPSSVFLGTASLQDDLDVHITVKKRPFWLDAFKRHGLVPHPEASLWQAEIEANHAFNWDASNTNVFVLRREA